LQGEDAYLRELLATTIHQLAAERERADVLQREALERIEALTAGQVNQVSDANQPRRCSTEAYGHL
jgi:hypothetical protein